MSCCPVRYLPVTQGDRLRKPSVEISILCAQVHLPVGRKLQKFWCILDWDTPWIFRYFPQTHRQTSWFLARVRCAHLFFGLNDTHYGELRCAPPAQCILMPPSSSHSMYTLRRPFQCPSYCEALKKKKVCFALNNFVFSLKGVLTQMLNLVFAAKKKRSKLFFNFA